MRTPALLLVAIAALGLTGCGDHNLVLRVDVLSYLEDWQRHIVVASVPGGSVPVPVSIVPDTTINLIEGLSGVAKVRSVTISLGGQVTVASGSGSGRFKVYLSDESTDPLTTLPVMDVPVQFSAGSPATVNAEAAGDPAVAELFTRPRLRLAVVIDSAMVAPPGASDLTVTLGRLEAVVIAGRKAF